MEQATANLRQGVRDTAHRFGLPALWRWWLAELAGSTPAGPRAAVQRRRMRPILAFSAEAAVVWVPRVNAGRLELVEQARIPLAGEPATVAQAGRTAIDGLARRVYGGVVAPTRLRIALPAAQVLRKQLVLPAAVEENLRQAIAWDLDRHTPFPAEQLYFDAVVVARDARKKEIRVDWAAALRAHVDQALRQAQAWGATVVGVTPDTPVEGRPPTLPASRLNLLPDEARPDSAPWRRWQVWLPLALLACAVAAAVALPIWQKREAVLALMKDAEQARVQAAAADALRTEFERMTGDYNFALARKYGYPPAVQLIEDVSRLLPDDTWLLQFELKTSARAKEPLREVVLRGESGSAGRLVALLEDSKLFEQASPRSPMTKIQPGPGEIFDLGTQLKPLPLPAMLELAAHGQAAPAAGPEGQAAASAPGSAVADSGASLSPGTLRTSAAVSAPAEVSASSPATGATEAPPAARPAVPPATTGREAAKP
ncbi:MAG: hypothetical protein IPH55_03205 [Betaproteobacteria bacterium]|nr:hypothetical protein [Betaproteobacteria bacterium]